MTARADLEVDLLVVGAGPAGSAAALTAAGGGIATLVTERRSVVGEPVRCGEYVAAALRREVPEGVLVPSQQVEDLTLHLPSGETRRLSAPGAVIDRGSFDRAMVRAAVDAGAALRVDSPLLELRRGGVAVVGGSNGRTIVKARLVIGCDGPRSTVARASGLGRPRVMVGLQREVALARPVESAHLYFWATCRYGYGWLFPKGATANLGVAVQRGAVAQGRTALAELTARLRAEETIDEEEAGRDDGRGDVGRGGLVPCSGPLPRLAAGRVMLAGDAAGQTDALTGAGVVAAVRGGTLAGQAAVEAFAAGSPARAGAAYEARWRQTLGRAAARSLERRFELEARWARDVERAVTAAWLRSSGGI